METTVLPPACVAMRLREPVRGRLRGRLKLSRHLLGRLARRADQLDDPVAELWQKSASDSPTFPAWNLTRLRGY